MGKTVKIVVAYNRYDGATGATGAVGRVVLAIPVHPDHADRVWGVSIRFPSKREVFVSSATKFTEVPG